MRPIRVIVYGLGRLNCIAVRLMLDKGVEIVGAVNRAGPKVGRDLGDVAGLQRALGVTVSDDAEAVLSVPADLAMVGVFDDMERMEPVYAACLEHRLNVITLGAHASSPWRTAPRVTASLDDLARRRGVTITGTGNQDFFMVNLGTLMSGTCHRISRITHRSLSDVNNFGAEVADIAHVGETLEAFEARRGAAPERASVYTTFWDNVAADLGLTVSGIVQGTEPITASEGRYCESLDRTVPPRSVIGIVQRLEVSTAEGIPMLGLNELRLFSDADEEEEYKEWSIEGEPGLTVRATGLETGLTTATQPVNRIPDVIAAPPGYVTLERLPKLTYRHRALHHYLP